MSVTPAPKVNMDGNDSTLYKVKQNNGSVCLLLFVLLCTVESFPSMFWCWCNRHDTVKSCNL